MCRSFELLELAYRGRAYCWYQILPQFEGHTAWANLARCRKSHTHMHTAKV